MTFSSSRRRDFAEPYVITAERPRAPDAAAPLSLASPDLRRYAAHYAARERDYVPTRPDDPRNPFTGLRRACERVLVRLEAPCSSDPPSETPDASATSARSPEVR